LARELSRRACKNVRRFGDHGESDPLEAAGTQPVDVVSVAEAAGRVITQRADPRVSMRCRRIG
jgi:hypothetical protein